MLAAGLIFGLVLLDLWLSRRPAADPVARAAVWSAVWVGVALGVCGLIGLSQGREKASSFLVAYLVEKSLSVDNLVVMLMIFRSFKIRPSSQPRVLKWGILGAVGFRIALIMAGLALLRWFRRVLILFGLLLLWAAYKMFTESDTSPTEDGDYTDSMLIRALKLLIPYDEGYRGPEFLHRNQRNQLCATPMLAALLVVEASDLVFAIDSVPCVLGITDDVFIAYSSNMLAILGLRSLFVLLADALGKLSMLRVGLALMMGFVGLKMAVADWVHISPWAALAVILGLLLVTAVVTVIVDARRARLARKETALVVRGCRSGPGRKRRWCRSAIWSSFMGDMRTG